MKRTSSSNSERPFKRRNDRPFNIIVNESNKDSGEQLLGSKTKGAVYLQDKKPEKQQFGNYIYGNYHSYYTYVIQHILIDQHSHIVDIIEFDVNKVLH